MLFVFSTQVPAPDPDDLEAYQLSLRSIVKSAKRIPIIRLSNVHLSLRTAKLLRRQPSSSFLVVSVVIPLLVRFLLLPFFPFHASYLRKRGAYVILTIVGDWGNQFASLSRTTDCALLF